MKLRHIIITGAVGAACFIAGGCQAMNNYSHNNYKPKIIGTEIIESESTGLFSSRKVIKDKNSKAIGITVYAPIPFRFSLDGEMYGLDWDTTYRSKDRCNLYEVIMERPWGSDVYTLEDAATKSFKDAEEDFQEELEELGLLTCKY